MNPATVDDDLFEQVTADFLARFRAGEEPQLDDYCARHPEIAAEIRELFPTMVAMERIKRQKENSSDGRASLGARKIDRLGDFRIVREIGRGGMGIVFEAVQESLERRVALKVLPPNALLDESHVRRFHREARTAAGLHHTNIVPVFGVGHDDGLHYYVMQLIEGEGLDRKLRLGERQPLEPLQAAGLVRQIADAVQYAHDHGTLHRDIKPANLLLDQSGNVWITDFGLARVLENEETMTDQVAGTLRYMAPERFQGVADERSDQYSLGITLYELVTAERAFQGNESGELLSRITTTDPVPPSAIVPSLPRDLETIIQKSIAKDPAHRYGSMHEFATDLQRFLEGRPILARRITVPEKLWRWAKRNRALAASLTSVALLLALVAGISTLGYYRTNELNTDLSSALGNERIALRRERQSRESAESIAKLALEGLDQVFDRFAPTSPYSIVVPLDELAGSEEPDNPLSLPAQPTVSPEVASVLAGLLPIYQGLADETGQDPRVQARAAAAQHRLGLIYQQLGKFDLGLEALQTARASLEPLVETGSTAPVELAQVLNDLGELQRVAFQRREAHQSHWEALGRLAQEAFSPDPLGVETRVELARTHYLLGRREFLFPSWGGRGSGSRGDRGEGRGSSRGTSGGAREGAEAQAPPQNPSPVETSENAPQTSSGEQPREGSRSGPRSGFGSPFSRESLRAHLDRAITLLEELPSDGRPPQATLLLARCYREQAALRPGNETDKRDADRAESIELLLNLVNGAPSNSTFRFELAETYADVEVWRLPPERVEKGLARLEIALPLAEQLVRDFPTVPAYSSALTQIRYKLAWLLRRNGRSAEAEPLLRTAIERQQLQSRDSPDAPVHAVWETRLAHELARLLVDDDRTEEAVQVLESAASTMSLYVGGEGGGRRNGDPQALFAPFLQGETYKRLADIFRDLGEDELAESYERKADDLRSGSRFPRRPPRESSEERPRASEPPP